MRCFLFILIITFCINCNNHKTDNKKNGALLTKTEAEELKDKLYKEYSLNLIVNRLKEIEDGIIKIGDLELKYDLQYSKQ